METQQELFETAKVGEMTHEKFKEIVLGMLKRGKEVSVEISIKNTDPSLQRTLAVNERQVMALTINKKAARNKEIRNANILKIGATPKEVLVMLVEATRDGKRTGLNFVIEIREVKKRSHITIN